ncbi:unnamed protein product [Cylindrotheca closterium]|uniref:Uncharacterized protein n=1 Tax=Cylindrotheca closterium TaxID=2856 RepID=A0AAD2FWK9_9STRA|nr:unnamed protein product [Cylindrotheca closterium]CAJ1954823.1 unnamed protein product [Cylindrotheca closterium]
MEPTTQKIQIDERKFVSYSEVLTGGERTLPAGPGSKTMMNREQLEELVKHLSWKTRAELCEMERSLQGHLEGLRKRLEELESPRGGEGYKNPYFPFAEVEQDRQRHNAKTQTKLEVTAILARLGLIQFALHSDLEPLKNITRESLRFWITIDKSLKYTEIPEAIYRLSVALERWGLTKNKHFQPLLANSEFKRLFGEDGLITDRAKLPKSVKDCIVYLEYLVGRDIPELRNAIPLAQELAAMHGRLARKETTEEDLEHQDALKQDGNKIKEIKTVLKGQYRQAFQQAVEKKHAELQGILDASFVVYQAEWAQKNELQGRLRETVDKMKANDDEMKAMDAQMKAMDAQMKVMDAQMKAKDAQMKAKDAQMKAKDTLIVDLQAACPNSPAPFAFPVGDGNGDGLVAEVPANINALKRAPAPQDDPAGQKRHRPI